MPESPVKTLYLTAGAAGMFCGSCMLDNSLARAAIRLGHEVLLTPLYTPIRTDDEDVSLNKVFFGGVNVYLQQRFQWARLLPRWLDGLLNQPWLIRQLTANTGKTSPELLGGLAISMLRGTDGYQRKEVLRLCDWIADDVKPDVVLLTNLLIGGGLPELRKHVAAKFFVILQGDDIFLDSLLPNDRARCIELMKKLIPFVDGFIVHSRTYGAKMASLLEIPEAKIHRLPLGLDLADFSDRDTLAEASSESIEPRKPNEFRIGYFARMAPEKGLHMLVDAFIQLVERKPDLNLSLHLAGWKGPQHQAFWDEQKAKLRIAGLEGRYRDHGSLNRQQKIQFLRSIDLFSVPTIYEEPKGLFVLEAVAAGARYIQPDHGAFPELHQRLQSGWLFRAKDLDRYVEQLEQSIADIVDASKISHSTSVVPSRAVLNEISVERMAARLFEIVG